MLFNRKSFLTLWAVAVFVATVCFASTSNVLQAHGGGTHDLALPGPLSHWLTGDITYKFQHQFPSNWKTWINAAATRLEADTFVDSLNEDTRSSNIIKIGTWPTVFGRLRKAGKDTCDYAGKVGGTLACAYPVSPGLLPVDLRVPRNQLDTLWKFAIVFDQVDVYQPGTTTVKPYWTEARVKSTSIHEFAHAVGYFEHIASGQHVLNPKSGVFYPSYDDKWAINRLYLHSLDARRSCFRSTIDMSRADLKMSAGKDYTGFLSRYASNPCPSTVHNGGLAYYYKMDTSKLTGGNSQNARGFTVSATTTHPRWGSVDAFAHQGGSPYNALGRHQGGSRVALSPKQDRVAQVAIKSKYSASYTLNVAPVCLETSNAIKVHDSNLFRAWTADDCISSTRPLANRGYTDFYNLEVKGSGPIQIDLQSNTVDTYLYLRRGYNNQTGSTLASDDDDGEGQNARITLPAGASSGQYTIEATTYRAGQTGKYTLAVLSLAPTPTPEPVPTPPLTAPSNVAASVSGSSIKATWTPGQNAARHTAVLLSVNNFRIVETVTATGNEHTFRGVASGSYMVVVTAYAADGRYLFKYVNVTVIAPTPTPTPTPLPRPAAPTNLTGQGSSSGSVTLDWNDAARAASYEVQQWDGRAPGWRTLPFRESGQTSDYAIVFNGSGATVSGLPKGVTYAHRVRSRNSAGFSAWTGYITTAVPTGGLSGQGGGEPADPTPMPP